MTDLKREYVVPLRRKTRTAPKWRRSKKAVCVLKDFIKKHMKTDSVILCPELNEKLWANGIKNPPGKVSVIALKTKVGDDEKTLVNLSEVGVDLQLKAYQVAQPVQKVKEEKTDSKKESLENVVDAEVKEKPVEVESKKTQSEAKESDTKVEATKKVTKSKGEKKE